MSNVGAQKKLVEQLRVEANIQRMRVSESLKELISYTEESQGIDVLVNGFPTKKDNPFQEKSSCTVL